MHFQCQSLTTHLLVALLTVVGVGPLKQISFNILLHGVQQVLVVSNVYVECCEWLLTLIPDNTKKLLENENPMQSEVFRSQTISTGERNALTCGGIPDRSFGQQRTHPAPCWAWQGGPGLSKLRPDYLLKSWKTPEHHAAPASSLAHPIT